MRNALLFTPLILAGCADLYPPPVPPSFEGRCNAAAAQRFIGQPVSREAGAAIQAATGATVLRWAAPSSMMTMEFSPVRVTVYYGTDYRISQVACG